MTPQLIRVTNGSCPDGGHPPGGRCLKICYCTKCPHYKPLPQPIQKPIKKRQSATAQNMAETVQTREDQTWIDNQ